MSVQSAIARVSQLEGMIAAANGGSPSPAAASSTTSFDQQLSQATDAQATSATSDSA